MGFVEQKLRTHQQEKSGWFGERPGMMTQVDLHCASNSSLLQCWSNAIYSITAATVIIDG